MIRYAKQIKENGECMILLGNNIEWALSQGYIELDVQQSDIDNNWYLADRCPMKTEEEKNIEERERINSLRCTKRVLVLILEQLGHNFYDDILPLIESNRQAKLEWDLCVELERSNPLIDIIGSQLGMSTDLIDNVFRYANGEILLTPKEEIDG